MKKYFLILLTFSVSGFAQVEPASELYQTLKQKDSLLFNVGFNNCDFSQFENLVGNDLKFYHDKGGITNSKADFIESMKNGICKSEYKPMRKLVKNSLVVYPLRKNGVLYGAIQMGIHEFYERQKGKPDNLTSTAKFTHVWLLENGNWKLTEVLSYDHR